MSETCQKSFGEFGIFGWFGYFDLAFVAPLRKDFP
jgi:hypothetical protein